MSHTYAEHFAEVPHGETFELELPMSSPRPSGRFEGPVFVLANRESDSNAVSVAALVQDYGCATVIGEATTDLATTYGAMEHFTLPSTGLRVGFPKALIVRPNGDERPAGVVPDVVVPNGDRAGGPQLERTRTLAIGAAVSGS